MLNYQIYAALPISVCIGIVHQGFKRKRDGKYLVASVTGEILRLLGFIINRANPPVIAPAGLVNSVLLCSGDTIAYGYMGLEVRKTLASRDEVAARRPEPPRASQSAPTDEPATSTPSASPVLAKDAVRINTLLEQAGIPTRSEKLSFVSEIAGREVVSSRDLTRPEAARVIEALSLRITQMEQQQ